MKKYDKNVSYAIAQVAQYERTFLECGPECEYEAARDFGANIIIMFYGANVSKDYDKTQVPSKSFAKAHNDLRNYLASDGTAVFHSTGFISAPFLTRRSLPLQICTATSI